MKKSDVDRLVAILEGGEYDNSSDLAKAMHKASIDLFTATGGWGVRAGRNAFVAGDKAHAKRVAKHFGLDPESAVVPFLGTDSLAYANTEIDTSRYCPECTHPKHAHRGHCLVRNCQCILQYKEGA